MAEEKMNHRPAPKKYQGKTKRRWPTRIGVALVSVLGMLGLWQFVAHEPPASTHDTPSFQDAEQQLQLGNSSDTAAGGFFSTQNAPSAPNVISGMS